MWEEYLLFERKLEFIARLIHFSWYIIPRIAKAFLCYLENMCLIWFEYTDFLISINPFTNNPVHWQICIEHILTRNASPLDRDEIKIDLMLTNMKSNIFPLISTIILTKVLTPFYSVHHEMLTVIYWNFVCDTIMSKIKINQHVSQLYKNLHMSHAGMCSIVMEPCHNDTMSRARYRDNIR